MAKRLVAEVGDSRLSGTRFTYDAREMLRATREIEATKQDGGDLWVGFQNASKIEHEAERYARITASGARVIAFGTGSPELPDDVRLLWIEVQPGTQRLENQWFLVSTEPEPIAFVSWEVSEPDRFGKGGIGDADKRFVGFVTDDRRVIDQQALERPALLDRVRGNTLDRFRDALPIQVTAADRDGVSALSAVAG